MSGDLSSGEKCSLYRDLPEWKDVTPIDIEDDRHGVMKIAYSDSFKDRFGYLRAVLKSGELSDRVFELTGSCVDENPSCYTVWLLRRNVIQHLHKSIQNELDFMSKQIKDNQKNYQVWYHRQKLIEWRQDPSGELEFIEEMLEEDSKNYHAWQYRQWLLKTFKLWSGELDFCNKLLEADCRNNSVWNQRYNVIQHTTSFTEEVVERELDYTIKTLKQVNCNESAWNYLQGILEFASQSQRMRVLKFCQECRDNGTGNVFLFSALLNIYEKDGDLKSAQEIASVLVGEDVLRKQYWLYRKQLLEKQS